MDDAEILVLHAVLDGITKIAAETKTSLDSDKKSFGRSITGTDNLLKKMRTMHSLLTTAADTVKNARDREKAKSDDY